MIKAATRGGAQHQHFRGRYRVRAYASDRELFPATGIETMRQQKITYQIVEPYQLQPGGVLVVPQIASEIRMIHKFENESEGVFPSGINCNERYEILVIVVETTVHQCFPVKPLLVTFSERNTLGSVRYSLSRRANSSTKNNICAI